MGQTSESFSAKASEGPRRSFVVGAFGKTLRPFSGLFLRGVWCFFGPLFFVGEFRIFCFDFWKVDIHRMPSFFKQKNGLTSSKSLQNAHTLQTAHCKEHAQEEEGLELQRSGEIFSKNPFFPPLKHRNKPFQTKITRRFSAFCDFFTFFAFFRGASATSMRLKAPFKEN